MIHEIDNPKMEQAIPYGYLCSHREIQEAIFHRRASGETPLGEGVLVEGGTIIYEEDALRLEVNGKKVIPHDFRVNRDGGYKVYHPGWDEDGRLMEFCDCHNSRDV